jgi:hypothetical protein
MHGSLEMIIQTEQRIVQVDHERLCCQHLRLGVCIIVRGELLAVYIH